MMNAVGGTSIHWMTQSWRFLPWNFKLVSESVKRYGPNAIPTDSTSIDWPFDYAELEPYYDKHEYFVGRFGPARKVSTGTIDPRGNIFEGPRRRPYPLSADAPNCGWTDMMAAAARSRSAGIPTRARPGSARRPTAVKSGLHLLRILRLDGLLHEREGADERRLHPAGREDEEPQGRRRWRTSSASRSDSEGPCPGALYRKGRREYFQPAKVVLLAAYTYGNVRLLLLSTSRAFPNGLSNNHGQVGKHWIAHGLGSAGATGWFPGKRLNRYSGTLGQFTAFDELDADNFDHTGLGFIGGGMCSARHGDQADRHCERDPAERATLGLAAGKRGWRRTPTPWPASARSSKCSRTRTTTSTSTRPCETRRAGR